MGKVCDCVNCHRVVSIRSRGMCFTCYKIKSIRNKYPSAFRPPNYDQSEHYKSIEEEIADCERAELLAKLLRILKDYPIPPRELAQYSSEKLETVDVAVADLINRKLCTMSADGKIVVAKWWFNGHEEKDN